MAKASFVFRIVYAVCLAAATYTHVVFHLRFGVFLESLTSAGYSIGTRIFWSSLTILDPIAVYLLFFRPRIGLILAFIIIVCDVLHNSWILHHLGFSAGPEYWAQVAFLVFVLATIKVAWRGLPRANALKNETTEPNQSSTAQRP